MRYPDWCDGCAIPRHKHVNLPEDWQEGDALPDDLTVHFTPREGYRFAFRGHPERQDRVRLP